MLRYKRHYFMASGINADSVAAEFQQHATEEQHTPTRSPRASCSSTASQTLNPDGLTTRSHAEYVEGKDLIDMIREDLVAERIAIDSYREMIHYVGDATRPRGACSRASSPMEEEHADDLVGLLEEMGN